MKKSPEEIVLPPLAAKAERAMKKRCLKRLPSTGAPAGQSISGGMSRS
jgi:hypothetical protein